MSKTLTVIYLAMYGETEWSLSGTIRALPISR
jgi:hypothetical protein